MKEKSIQIFLMIKCQKKILILFCLLVTFIDSVFRMGKNQHLQVFLEEFKYTVKDKEVTRHISESPEILTKEILLNCLF